MRPSWAGLERALIKAESSVEARQGGSVVVEKGKLAGRLEGRVRPRRPEFPSQRTNVRTPGSGCYYNKTQLRLPFGRRCRRAPSGRGGALPFSTETLMTWPHACTTLPSCLHEKTTENVTSFSTEHTCLRHLSILVSRLLLDRSSGVTSYRQEKLCTLVTISMWQIPKVFCHSNLL